MGDLNDYLCNERMYDIHGLYICELFPCYDLMNVELLSIWNDERVAYIDEMRYLEWYVKMWGSYLLYP